MVACGAQVTNSAVPVRFRILRSYIIMAKKTHKARIYRNPQTQVTEIRYLCNRLVQPVPCKLTTEWGCVDCEDCLRVKRRRDEESNIKITRE